MKNSALEGIVTAYDRARFVRSLPSLTLYTRGLAYARVFFCLRRADVLALIQAQLVAQESPRKASKRKRAASEEDEAGDSDIMEIEAPNFSSSRPNMKHASSSGKASSSKGGKRSRSEEDSDGGGTRHHRLYPFQDTQ